MKGLGRKLTGQAPLLRLRKEDRMAGKKGKRVRLAILLSPKKGKKGKK